MNPKSNAAKFTFFYLLSLISLIFTALPAGMIIFQVINKYVSDPLANFQSDFSLGALKFAISALLVAAPVYYLISRQINSALFKGDLDKDSGLRKWLTYFILLVSSLIVIGSLIGVVNSFLNGELTGKFILKMLTTIIIPAFVFSYYFYDIKRETLINSKDKNISRFFFGSLAFVILAFAAGLLSVESPRLTRDRLADDKIINNFYSVESAINEYYRINSKLPADLATLQKSQDIQGKGFEPITKDTVSGKDFGYEIASSTAYRLCAEFRTSNANLNNNSYIYNSPSGRRHEQGWQCFEYTIDPLIAEDARKLKQ